MVAVIAEPVYRLFDKCGLETNRQPVAEEPIFHTIGYYIHEGYFSYRLECVSDIYEGALIGSH